MLIHGRKHFESSTFLLNPTRLPRYTKKLQRILRSIDVGEVIETTSRDHFLDCVRRFYNGPDRYLFVWGGDGTAHDAINAFMHAADTDTQNRRMKSLGFLRGGSGNGIQDSYEVPFSLQDQLTSYAESVKNNYTINVDLLKIRQNENTDYCQLAGVGFDAAVLKRREHRKTVSGGSRSGFMNYVVSFFESFAFDRHKLETSYMLELIDGKYAFRGHRVNAEFPITHLVRTVRPFMIEAGTRPYYGKLFRVCPDVVCNDGNIDVYVYNMKSRRSIIMNALSLWTGNHGRINKRFARRKLPLIERYEVQKVRINSDKPFDYHIDGELKSSRSHDRSGFTLEIEIVPRAISFIVPASFYWKFTPFKEEPATVELMDPNGLP